MRIGHGIENVAQELSDARKRNRIRLGKPAVPNVKITRPKRIKCAICSDVVSGKEMHYDHCHKSGEHRGWLCRSCNTGLGMFKDSSLILGNAIKYLQSHHFKMFIDSHS